jgi:exoribonuclease R
MVRLVDHDGSLSRGLDELRRRFDVPEEFPAAVIAEADQVVSSRTWDERTARVDRTDVDFVTLDPVGSTDLDQAFAIESSGPDLILRYAIADVGAFVRPGGAIDAEAWRRGVTLYLPDGRAGLHPPQLAEGAASLLSGVERPAVVFVVRVGDDGAVHLDGAERAVVRSRAQLAYATVDAAQLPTGFNEFGRRIEAAESDRGADRIDMPEQEVVRRDGAYTLRFRPRRAVERQGAAMSLATNMAVADALFAAGTGLFRTMPAVDDRGVRRLRHTARAFGLDWPSDLPLDRFEPTLDRDDPRTAAFQLAVRRASGKASYEPFRTGVTPWHAAVAAKYTHATAPLRRLADRFVVEAAVSVVAGRPVESWVDEGFEALPAVMDAATARASQIDRAALDLAEAVVLSGREGELFDAVVTDEDDRGVRIQVCDPAIVARLDARRVDPGDEVRVRLVRVDVGDRRVEFERVA